MRKDVLLPEVSENVAEATVVKVLVAPGQAVKSDQPLVEVETDKALFELPAPFGGTIAEVLVEAGARIRVGQVLFRLEVGEEAPREAGGEVPAGGTAVPPTAPAGPALPPEPAAPPAPPPAPPPASPSGPASPAVRKLARELGVNLGEVRGTGPRGRITLEDVKAKARELLAAPPAPAPGRRPLPDLSKWGPVRREPFSTIRRVTAEAMARAWAEVPQVTQYDRAEISSLEALRERLRRKGGVKVTPTAVLVKVAAAALRAFPRFNASVDMERGEVVLRETVHIGVAVDTEHGLLVPVVRDADRKGILSLAREIADLAERARQRRLQPGELEGGTFTVSNLGGIGGTGFSPIVYWPQVAILGVSRVEVLPHWNGQAFEPRPYLPLSLSYDHRILDGAEGARFLRWICEALEDPWRLVL
ncbi:MAG: 2-oxo acid dehydrogenase subunit E2 [Acidobacteriota bacterium]